jgi:hypothetical protein
MSLEELQAKYDRLIAHRARLVRYYDEAPDGSQAKADAVDDLSGLNARILGVEREIDEALTHEGEVVELVYECWVAGERGTFSKLKSDDKLGLVAWLMDVMRNHDQPGDHIHIVVHGKDEYNLTN